MLPTSEERFSDTYSYHTDISFFRKLYFLTDPQ